MKFIALSYIRVLLFVTELSWDLAMVAGKEGAANKISDAWWLLAEAEKELI